jgi:hypothetical protein
VEKGEEVSEVDISKFNFPTPSKKYPFQKVPIEPEVIFKFLS